MGGLLLFAVPTFIGFVFTLSVKQPVYNGLIRACWLLTLIASFMWLYSALFASWSLLGATGWTRIKSPQWWMSFFYIFGSVGFVIASISAVAGHPTKWNTTLVFLLGNIIYLMGSVTSLVLLCKSFQQE